MKISDLLNEKETKSLEALFQSRNNDNFSSGIELKQEALKSFNKRKSTIRNFLKGNK